MPSLLRFLSVVAILGGLAYGGLYALANLVTPKPREMTVFVPPEKFPQRRIYFFISIAFAGHWYEEASSISR